MKRMKETPQTYVYIIDTHTGICKKSLGVLRNVSKVIGQYVLDKELQEVKPVDIRNGDADFTAVAENIESVVLLSYRPVVP